MFVLFLQLNGRHLELNFDPRKYLLSPIMEPSERLFQSGCYDMATLTHQYSHWRQIMLFTHLKKNRMLIFTLHCISRTSLQFTLIEFIENYFFYYEMKKSKIDNFQKNWSNLNFHFKLWIVEKSIFLKGDSNCTFLQINKKK